MLLFWHTVILDQTITRIIIDELMIVKPLDNLPFHKTLTVHICIKIKDFSHYLFNNGRRIE